MAEGLIFDKENSPAEGIWKEYQPGVEVKIRPMTKSIGRQLRDQATATIRGSRFRREQRLDEALFDRLLFRHMIEDWRGIYDPAGEPIPCTDENIDLITDRLLSFAGWVAETSAVMAEEELLKN